MPEYVLEAPTSIVDLLAAAGLANSKSDGRRLVKQGGVRIDDVVVGGIDEIISVDAPAVMRVGKRRFVRLLPA